MKDTGIKLCPFERSVMRQFSDGREMTMQQIVVKIRYAKQEDLENWLWPILERLVTMGFLEKGKEGYYKGMAV